MSATTLPSTLAALDAVGLLPTDPTARAMLRGSLFDARRVVRERGLASLDADDLSQIVALALLEQPPASALDAGRLMRNALQRAARGRGMRPTVPLPWEREGLPNAWTTEPADPSPEVDPDRWAEALDVRLALDGLPVPERTLLEALAVDQVPLYVAAARLGVRQHTARVLRLRARLLARARLGADPPPEMLEARVLAAARLGADARTGRVPAVCWLVPRTGVGRHRVRTALRRLASLGYVTRERCRWRLCPREASYG